MKQTTRFTLIAIIALLLAACGGAAEATTEAPDPTEASVPFIALASATGKVVPAEWATLSIASGGIIAELAEENAQVSEGDVLLVLDGGEAASAAIAAATVELVQAEQALEELNDNATLSTAEAEQAVADARDAVRDAERVINNLEFGSKQTDIDQAFANLVLAKDDLDDAREDYEPYSDKPETNLERARYLSLLAQAQADYDDAVRLYNNLTGVANEIDLDQAIADLAVAQAQLENAQQNLEDRVDGPDPDLAEQAIARVENAQAQLTAAEAAFDDLTLEAPFDGTVSEVYVRISEWVNPGQAVILVGDLDNLQVETTDLNEIDVARISVGNPATVTFDALPNVVVNGTVVSISPKASEGTGVNFKVVIELDEIPAGLRWDMTAFVDIETD
ncbi:MAG: HlyD family efflux transporter periplasmic adaptor subunit [Chloroflexi bacterium]|nr:HlyD family efflux transporter periplasmic adaptor subunit [Chloroflexota bacterium]